jgi:hypothetical protein
MLKTTAAHIRPGLLGNRLEVVVGECAGVSVVVGIGIGVSLWEWEQELRCEPEVLTAKEKCYRTMEAHS